MKTFSLSPLAACGLVLLALALPLPAKPIEGVNADGHAVTLNAKDLVTVVISSSPDTQERTRQAGSLIDTYRGRKDFRLIIVVDLRDSLAGIVPDFVKSQIRTNLDTEAKRLIPFYRKNGNPGNPRTDLAAIPDFDGKLVDALKWNPDDDLLRVTVFGRDGNVLHYWEDLKAPEQLRDVVAKALGDAKP
ncbi:hypothetical protein SAMN05444156_0340 [Verrucomicrobium sp. GAS474]|uniref:hypothetical protein n=1 Tax=Verrucomicrobium sp. GAS474 TaxID=1882831 RepID=UPI00087B688C|nr:hypothetical protein [Verrucomicrobium sp. GAS474]SDT87745.1 hypothetical protein SAMN05444156_0340 [Verrucomicrobium sp. GAS474]